MNEKQQNEYKGFSLFNDVEDADLRIYNRARILVNIAQDYTNKLKRISPGGAALILGYFSRISPDDRGAVKDSFATLMKKEGYGLTSPV